MYEQEFQTIFNHARNLVDDIEIMLVSGNSFSVRIHEKQIEAFNYNDSKGIGVRVIKNGKIGYAYTEEFTEDAFRLIVEEAAENSKFNEESDPVVMADYPDVENKPKIYSKELDLVPVEHKIAYAKDLEKYAKSGDHRIINVPYALYSDGKSFVKIANSKGLNKEDLQNYAFSFAGVLAAENDDKRMGVEYVISRDFNDFKAEVLARKCVQKGIRLLGGIEIESGSYPVVFNNEMMTTLLSTFSEVFSAKSVQEGKSLLQGKMGEMIADEQVSIIDDALYPDGFASRSFDSEGYPSQRTPLIASGKLVNLLHNTITAAKDGVRSTGNAARDYKGTLEISTSNFYLEPGKLAVSELFQSHEKVIEIVSLQGMHSGANSISGDFSLSAEGFLYENGVRKTSLKQFTVSGNFLEVLKDVEAIASDIRFDTNSCGAPSALIKQLSVSGK